MLFIYLLEGHREFSKRVQYLLQRSYERGDSLFTSHLAVGEILAGAEMSSDPQKKVTMRQTIDDMGFSCLPFDRGAVDPFSTLRAKSKIKVADAIHIACAASAGIDLFLTGDRQLSGLNVPGVQFIVEFNTQVL
jgi:predicted nucleic acid-binding protein